MAAVLFVTTVTEEVVYFRDFSAQKLLCQFKTCMNTNLKCFVTTLMQVNIHLGMSIIFYVLISI